MKKIIFTFFIYGWWGKIFDCDSVDQEYIWMGYNFSGFTFGPKGMIIQESLGILPVNAFLTHPIAHDQSLKYFATFWIKSYDYNADYNITVALLNWV